MQQKNGEAVLTWRRKNRPRPKKKKKKKKKTTEAERCDLAETCRTTIVYTTMGDERQTWSESKEGRFRCRSCVAGQWRARG